MNEHLWRKAEANQVMRERRARIKSGVIKFSSKPNVLVKIDGVWKFPEISDICRVCLWPAGACVGHNDECPY